MFCTATFHFNTGSLNKTVVLICAKGKTKSQQLEKEYEEEKRAWKAETDHLLNKQKELMSYLYAGKKAFISVDFKERFRYGAFHCH